MNRSQSIIVGCCVAAAVLIAIIIPIAVVLSTSKGGTGIKVLGDSSSFVAPKLLSRRTYKFKGKQDPFTENEPLTVIRLTSLPQLPPGDPNYHHTITSTKVLSQHTDSTDVDTPIEEGDYFLLMSREGYGRGVDRRRFTIAAINSDSRLQLVSRGTKAFTIFRATYTGGLKLYAAMQGLLSGKIIYVDNMEAPCAGDKSPLVGYFASEPMIGDCKDDVRGAFAQLAKAQVDDVFEVDLLE